MRTTKARPGGDVPGTTARPPSFQPLDFGLKLTEPGVCIVGKLIGCLVLFGQAIEFRVSGSEHCLAFRRQHHSMRVRPAHAVVMREVEMGFRSR